MSKICLARVDRIGDLVLTLPCEKFWKSRSPQDEIHWLVSENLNFVMEAFREAFREALREAPGGVGGVHTARPVKTFFEKIIEAKKVAGELRAGGYDVVVALHVPWWIAAAIFFAGIKRRVGTASQWFSWIFFNERLRQRRSQATQHEARYNLDLVTFAMGAEPDGNASPGGSVAVEPARLTPRASVVAHWRQKLSGLGIAEKKFVLIHPGMAGSARNWPAGHYKNLAEQLVQKKIPVVVTGAAVDEKFLQETQILKTPGVHDLSNQTDGPSLLALIHLAGAVVAPSTGVVHLASSVGTPVAGIYSPVKVQAPLRWGPLGKPKKIFVPEVACPGVRSCLQAACPHFDCMERIPVDSVASYVMDIL